MFLQNVLLITQVESSFAVKDLGVTVHTKLNTRQQPAVSEKVIKSFLDFIIRSAASRLREVIVPSYTALVRPNLEFSVLFLAPQYTRNMDLLERAQ